MAVDPMPAGLALVSRDGESHSNLGFGFDRLSRLIVRIKAPLFHGFTRGSKKNLWTTDWLEALDVSIFVDARQQHHRPFHGLLFHQQRIRDSYRRRCQLSDRVRRRNRFVMQIEVDGVISSVHYLVPATTRDYFHREWRPDGGFGDSRGIRHLCLRSGCYDGVG